MAIVLDGTNGIDTPDLASAGPVSGTTGTFSGAVQASGVATNLYPLVSGTAVASTSGTSIDFTGIPSWVKRITVMFQGVSTNGPSAFTVQIGSGSFPTSGYAASVMCIEGTNTTSIGTSTTLGFLCTRSTFGAAAALFTGHLVITNISGNGWVASGIMSRTDTGAGSMNTGNITLGGVLDRLRVTTTGGTDTFDAGSINILYE